MHHKPSKPVDGPVTLPESSSARNDDPIARTRASPALSVTGLPAPPSGLPPIDPREARYRVFYVADGEVKPLVYALHWVADNGETSRADFGPRAPDPEAASKLARRIEGLLATESRLAALTVAVKQQLAVALSDGHDMVDRVAADAEYHGKDDPAFLERYGVAVGYRKLRGQSVVEGRERARRARQSKKANGARTPTAQTQVASDKPANDKPTASDKPASDKPAA